jgi:hypothetical protein
VTWFVIRWDGQTYTEDLTGSAEKVLTALGIHGYATEAEAEAHPQTMNTLQAALGGANALAGTTAGTTDQPGAIAAGAGTAASAAESATSGITAFLKDLTSRNLWLRVLKVAAGLGLIITGVVQLTHAQNLVKTAAKGALLA